MRLSSVRIDPDSRDRFGEPLAISRWPFRHTVIDDFLPAVQFQGLVDVVGRLEGDPGRWTKHKNYGASICSLGPSDADDFSDFIRQDFVEQLSRSFDVATSDRLDAAVHIHSPGSPDGWVHNDFNAAWFGEDASGQRPRLLSRKAHRQPPADGRYERYIRSVAVILYLDDGRPDADSSRPRGDDKAGATGLYLRQRQAVRDPTIVVGSSPNRMLAFECSPHSYHSFIGGCGARRSVIFWCHVPADVAAKRWPLDLVAGWHE